MAEIFEKGVDVFQYQGEIDWQKVKAQGWQYAILRAVSSNQQGVYVDRYFERNYQNAKAAGLKLGVYYYTYAQTEQQAIEELELLLSVLEGKQLEYPVFVDMEDSSIAALGRQTATRLAAFALAVLDQKKWYSGLYTYSEFARRYLDLSQLSGYPLFIADYRGYVGYPAEFDMWQYTSTGSVNGITTNVDLSNSYTDFLPAIRRGGYNGFAASAVLESIGDAKLEVFASNNEYFFSPDVNDIAGKLPLGSYAALARTVRNYNGFDWVTILYEGTSFWTALLSDRNRLVQSGCVARSERDRQEMRQTAQQLRDIAEQLENTIK